MALRLTQRLRYMYYYWSVLTTIHPVRKKMTTPKMLIIHDVKTPSQVPNRTGSEMKKFDCHHGRLRDDYKQTNIQPLLKQGNRGLCAPLLRPICMYHLEPILSVIMLNL